MNYFGKKSSAILYRYNSDTIELGFTDNYKIKPLLDELLDFLRGISLFKEFSILFLSLSSPVAPSIVKEYLFLL